MRSGTTFFLIDIGSTFTKVAVVDVRESKLLARVNVPSTVEEDVTIGLREAVSEAERLAGVKSVKETRVACSSAAGGLRMVCIGFVPSLSLKAAKEAALGAGAKLVGNFFSAITPDEVEEIEKLNPDLILLVGGIDGGDKDTLVHNAKMIAASALNTPVIIAGNKEVQNKAATLLRNKGKNAVCVPNVMPEVDKLNVDPCRQVIRELFVKRIVKAKGLENARSFVSDIVMPTPEAVLKATVLLAKGVEDITGMGGTMVIDVGGATTDVHSVVSSGVSEGVLSGDILPEPEIKRTVEGDLGVRHNVDCLIKIGLERHMLTPEEAEGARRYSLPGKLPQDERERKLDSKLAQIAVEVAVERHVGRWEVWHGPMGKRTVQRGKDCRHVAFVVGTGGSIAYSTDPREILSKVLFADNQSDFTLLKPLSPSMHVDNSYILYAAGLLSIHYPKEALEFIKKYLKQV